MKVEAAICSERESIMTLVWKKCQQAWVDGEFERSQNLHRMYVLFEGMTDQEYREAYVCECINCECTC